MIDICIHCGYVMAGRSIQLVEDKDGVRKYTISCSNCGAGYEVMIANFGQPTLDPEKLKEFKNRPVK